MAILFRVALIIVSIVSRHVFLRLPIPSLACPLVRDADMYVCTE